MSPTLLQETESRGFCFFQDLFFIFIFWLQWIFVASHGLSRLAASRGSSVLWSMGFSLQWLFSSWSTGCRVCGLRACGSETLQTADSTAVVHGLHCSKACGIFPDWGSDCTARQILNHWTTGEAQSRVFEESAHCYLCLPCESCGRLKTARNS